ncbi:MAG: hypothetical protein Q4G33_06805 [bacterium]|nr:hypothetical protein [bacterium]
MDRIYDDAKDLHVRAVCVYGKANDTAAYTDSDCTEKFKTDELKEVFLKGAVVIIGNDYFVPISFIIKNGIGTVTYVTANSSSATTAVLATLSAVKD